MDFTNKIQALEQEQHSQVEFDIFSDRRNGNERRHLNNELPDRRCRRTSIRARRTKNHFNNANWWLQRDYVDSDILVLHSETIHLVSSNH